jgi:hypothetical protein
MNATNYRHRAGKAGPRPLTNRLHPRVYSVFIALTAWFALAVWSFAGAGLVDYLLVIVSGFMFVVVALTVILSQVGHDDPAAARGGDSGGGGAGGGEPSLRDWAKLDYDTRTGRLGAPQAAAQILLPVAAAAIGMTVIGILFRVVEHAAA